MPRRGYEIPSVRVALWFGGRRPEVRGLWYRETGRALVALLGLALWALLMMLVAF